ncbi:hypothetical protein CAPTEDRAFT_5448 [Capitella teleta]|uniref:Lipase n=1 Tax=Capitella teleta TaxID=283909 RepID=R7T4F7_CAPTE|nr:hypothetical protein CAPTEDRAFT_5448 [Capitella teleta]|eukprot:ELT87656.1 hypothetical protein CAPTEDRAFT_5448 [Capitella teleta]
MGFYGSTQPIRTELIVSKGYPCEEHTVQTDDGFLLGVQRIPYGRRGPGNDPRPVVFLQHGLLSASTCWITNLANESLGYILADAGFDVWLGNVRGNTYSRKHIKLQPEQHDFWQWSWDEMAYYDLPAMLNYALRQSSQERLSYVGHSQGTLIAFTGFSANPDLAKKVKQFVALGPVAQVGHLEGAVRYLSYITPELEGLFDLFGIDEFLPSSRILKFLGSTLCEEKYTRDICENIFFLICGYDSQNMNVSRIPVYVSHSPAGTSVKNLIHFAQMVKSNRCQKYDYGMIGNFEHYRQLHAPIYNISAMDVPSYLFSSGKDTLADPTDVKYLLSQLPNLKYHEEILHWNHLDFIWAMDANVVLYPHIIKILRN